MSGQIKNMQGYEFLDEKYKALLAKARDELKAEIELVQPLGGGYSGAHLFLCRIIQLEETDSTLVILKLDKYSKNKNEKDQHVLASSNYSEVFRAKHLVEMAYPAVVSGGRIALFYNIVGQSLADFRPLRNYREATLISSVTRQVVEELLDESRADYDELFGYEIISKFFQTRYKVDNNKIAAWLSENYSIDPESGLIIQDRVLPSPYSYLVSKSPQPNEKKVFLPVGPQHGDLNTGNILLSSPKIPTSLIQFNLIDLIHFVPNGSCLFDILSLELGLILDFAPRLGISVEDLFIDISNLGNWNFNDDNSFSTEISGLVEIIKILRGAVSAYINKKASSYHDYWIASANLAGITAGLIAANTQGLDDNLRMLAYVYSASHLDAYYKRFKMTNPVNKASKLKLTRTNETPINNKWQPFYAACNSFASDHIYIGIFGPVNHPELDLEILGRVPWGSVIDFDPFTEDEHHLLDSVRNKLDSQRFVHLLQPGNNQELYPDRACYWFSALGLRAKDQPYKDISWREWNRSYANYLESFISRLARSTIKPVTVVTFWENMEFVSDVIKMVDRHFCDRVNLIAANNKIDRQDETIEKFDIELFALDLGSVISGLRSSLPATREISSEILLPALVVEGIDLERKSIRIELPTFNWIEEECELLHLEKGLNQEITNENDSFLMGRKITWFEINTHVDTERDLTRNLERKIIDALDNRTSAKINLMHTPGAGGTTVAYRIAWDLHWYYPVLLVKTLSNEIIERIKYVYSITQLPVLAIVDFGTAIAKQGADARSLVDGLISLIRAGQTPAVVLIVMREFDPPQQLDKQNYFLPQQLTNREAGLFASTLSKMVPSKSSALENLAGERTPEKRTPFYFGITAFEKNFKGIDNFVQMRVKEISENERKILGLISLAYYFGQQSVPAQIFTVLLGLASSKSVDLRRYMRKQRMELLISDDISWRPLHFIVAEEILIQLLAGQKERDKWRELLSQYAVELITIVGEVAEVIGSDLNIFISDLLRGLFLERQGHDLFDDIAVSGGQTSKFSEYIEQIPAKEGKRLVFDTLVDVFPQEAHYWGHRARLIWNYAVDVDDYLEAVRSVDKALSLGNDNDAPLYHIKGMALAKYASFLMQRTLQEYLDQNTPPSNEILLEIKKLFNESSSVFKYIRDEIKPTEERAYISAIELLTRYIEFAKAISPYKTFGEFFRSPGAREYYEYLTEAENLLNHIRRIKTGSGRTSPYIETREVFLRKLYDDYSSFIEGLRNLVDNPQVYQPPYRRSLAFAYLARRNRNWDEIPTKELESIQGLMERNLIAEPGNAKDIRIWFEAARRLPTTSLSYAIEKLAYWVSHAGSVDILDANYYLYVLQALSAIEGSEMAALQAQRTIEKCKHLAQDRFNRTFSLDWIGKGKGITKLVNHALVGRFNAESGDFENSSHSLERLSGRIEKIESRQAGKIMAYGLAFFFTPFPRLGHQFLAGKNENDLVEFFVGFSYDGPRAWGVSPIEKVQK
jgi:hypothetical protein